MALVHLLCVSVMRACESGEAVWLVPLNCGRTGNERELVEVLAVGLCGVGSQPACGSSGPAVSGQRLSGHSQDQDLDHETKPGRLNILSESSKACGAFTAVPAHDLVENEHARVCRALCQNRLRTHLKNKHAKTLVIW